MNNNNEYLFWKVFKNKFLFNNIINQIHSTEWIIYDDHKQLHINNRLKFKDIHSLHWMIQNKQYQLLNYKLNNSDENILILPTSISLLFKKLSIENINNNITQDDEIQIIKDIINKFLLLKRNEFEIIDLTKEAVKYNSLEILKLLLSNETYSIPIYPSTLEYAIRNSHPSIVQEILNNISTSNNNNNNNEIFKEIENKSLDLSFENKNYQIEMIEFILLNFKLLPSSSSSSSSSEDTIEQPKKKFKSSSLEIISNTKNKLKFSTFLKIKSNSVKKVLFENNLILNENNLIETEFDIFECENIQDLIYIYKTIFESSNIENEDDQIITLKELQKLFLIKLKKEKQKSGGVVVPPSIQILNEGGTSSTTSEKVFKEFYEKYIRKYKETINECHDEDNEEDISNAIEIYSDDNEIYNQLLKFKEFIRISEIFLDDEIKYTIQEKQDIIKDCINGVLKWNDILFDLIVFDIRLNLDGIIISDKLIIDWLLNQCNNKQIKKLFSDYLFSDIIFTSFELIDYVYKESNILQHLFNLNQLIDNPISLELEKSIMSNKQPLAIINCILYNLKLLNSPAETDDDQIFNENLPKIIKLINHLNEIGFEGFDQFNFRKLIIYLKRLFSTKYANLMNLNIKLNIKNSLQDQIITYVLFEEIAFLNLKFVELLVINSNLFNNSGEPSTSSTFKFTQDDINIFNRLPKYLYSSNSKIYHFKEIKDVNSRFEIIEIIEKLIIKFKSIINIEGEGGMTRELIDNHPISLIVNYFFENLIQIKGISMKQVKYVYELIESSSIKIEHTLLHSFYYLHIKDIKFTYYILSRPEILDILKSNEVSLYSLPNQYDDNNGRIFNLSNYFDISSFTFQSINNQSFDSILELLINQLSNNRINSFSSSSTSNGNDQLYKNQFYDQVSKDLEFFLIIKRVDLFFSKLKFINYHLDIETKKNKFDDNSFVNFPKVSSLFNSPFQLLLSTSKEFEEIPSQSPSHQKKLEFQPTNILVNTFLFNINIVNSICRILNLNEIKKVIKFNFYQSAFIYHLLFESVFISRYDVVKFLYDNFKIELIKLNIMPPLYDQYKEASFILKNYFKSVAQFPCKFKENDDNSIFNLFKFKFLHLLENHFQLQKYQNQFQQFISNTTSIELKIQILNESFKILKLKFDKEYQDHHTTQQQDNDEEDQEQDEFISETKKLSNHKILFQLFKSDEYQNLFKLIFNNFQNERNQLKIKNNEYQHIINIDDGTCNNGNCNFNENDDNPFLTSFIRGNIKLCELILSYYPNYNFKLTKSSISLTIKNQKIHIIKYFLINHKNLFNNQDLINHLKFELDNHINYKYLNLL